MISFEYDPERDVLYVRFQAHQAGLVHSTRQLDEQRLLDLDAEGAPVGVELLYASDGITLRDLPRADEIAGALRQSQLLKILPVP